uniref:HTH CENPB-type domain-containing protein n=1 Tax=Rhizophagus irregularis (strain DAOM 181602 / DAOM 197198 / MUCL 43194) TaxID=747089 RepID=U9UF26_RHIID
MSQLQVKRKLTQDASQTKKRVVLTHAQKRQLFFDILKKKEKWLNVNPDSEESNKQKEKPVRFPQVEKALSLWITNALAADLVIIDTDILREKAKFFAQQFEVNNFAASNGWINGFKERHSLKQYVKWGEAKSAPLETLDEERKILREIIKDYDLNDVFNCDETGNPKFSLK